jgi:Holliday junction resolvase RusA-like endonuclease
LVPSYTKEAFGIPLRVDVLFAVPRSKSSTLPTPVGDGDNYEKATFDLLQAKGYVEDDRWITSATWRKRFLPYGTPGYTLVVIYKETEEIELC